MNGSRESPAEPERSHIPESGDGSLRVLKLGGSLLDFPTWPNSLAQWLARQPVSHWVLVAGGGPWAEAVRSWDEQLGLGEEYCHELCGRLMSLTADLVCHALSTSVEFPLAVRAARTLEDVRSASLTANAPMWVLDAGRYLLEESPIADEPLPRNWTVTSDSIAADVARRLQASELVLLKSRPAAVAWTLDQAAQEGAVDAHFPQVAFHLPRVRWVNLRDPAFETVCLASRARR